MLNQNVRASPNQATAHSENRRLVSVDAPNLGGNRPRPRREHFLCIGQLDDSYLLLDYVRQPIDGKSDPT